MDKTDHQSYAELMEQGRTAYFELHLDEALEFYRAAEALQPDSYDVQLGLAQTLARVRQQDAAYVAAQKAISLDPERAEGYAALGALHFLTDRYDEAITTLHKAVDLAPSNPEPHLTLTQVYSDTRRFDEAEAELGLARTLLEALPDENKREQMIALAWHAETYLRIEQGRQAEATEAAQQVIAMAEVSPYAACLAYSNLGILEARARHYDQAIEYLEHAYQINPFFYRAAGALARVLIVRNKHARAAEILARIVDVIPRTGGATRYAYALTLAKLGRRTEALTQYRQALQEGLTGMENVGARWQVIWLSTVGRYVVIGVILTAVLVWLLLAKPSPQTLTLLLLLALILILRQTIGRKR
jgi:tetratricopeptide (TPR) repeat protein